MKQEGLDAVLVAALIKHCEVDSSLWRPHPIVPWVKEGIEYQIPLRELTSKLDTQATTRGVRSTANIELASAPKLAGLLRPGWPAQSAVPGKAAAAVVVATVDPAPP
jgi:hypothetical protein